MYKGIVVYTKNHPYEPDFYAKVCGKYRLYPLPAVNTAKSFRNICKAIDENNVIPVVFVIHRGVSTFFGDFDGRIREKNYIAYHIEEKSMLLHWLSRDKTALEKVKSTEYSNSTDFGFCDKIYEGRANLDVSYSEWINALDLDYILSHPENADVFGDFARVLAIKHKK